MEKVLTVDQVQGVKIDDYYTGNYGTDGSDYDTNNIPTITYKIPFNAFRTDTGGWEYRLNYYVGGAEKRVIYFNDLENEFEDIPQEVISRAEWNAHKTFRDKYNITIDGIDIEFDKTYQINYKNYQCKVRIITMEQDFISNETNITAMEIDNE
jgi:hypothetical protein